MEFNLADLWERIADAIPEHEAMVCGERRLTYAEVDERATRLAHHLAALGIGVGDHVALYLHNGTEYLEGMLAAFKLRAVPINVNYRYGDGGAALPLRRRRRPRRRVPPGVRGDARGRRAELPLLTRS